MLWNTKRTNWPTLTCRTAVMYQVASSRDVSVGLVVSIALLVHLLPQVCTGQSCTFPDYLLQQSRWETNLSLERRVIGAFWSFTLQTAENTDLLSISSDNKRNYTCSVQLEDEKYIVSTLLTDNFVSFRSDIRFLTYWLIDWLIDWFFFIWHS